MPIEFLGIAATSDGSETTARTGPIFDKEYTLRLARAHEENGWDRVLFDHALFGLAIGIGLLMLVLGWWAGLGIAREVWR